MGAQQVLVGTPAVSYSPAIIAAGPVVYVSGQGPLRDGLVQDGTIEEQTRLTLENLAAVLGAAGAGLGHVVKCGVYLADLNDFAAMDAVFAEVMSDPLPARTTIGCALRGIKVEIDAIAVLPASAGRA